MEPKSFEILDGGNMNKPLKKGNLIYKDITIASETIHQLLCHVRKKGILWVSESIGIQDGKHVFSFINGEVPDYSPQWLWNKKLLFDIALRLRQWHDATMDFEPSNAKWLLKNDEPNEVICHSDFAPYNCVFENLQFKGLIDFDVCAPGSRLWDIAYTAYTFIPLRPDNYDMDKLNDFLKAYSLGEQKYLYSLSIVIPKISKRLIALSNWSRKYALKNSNNEMLKHAEMYQSHAKWALSLL
ncbi:MAG: phosphotransferase [Spirochaetales bacterium]|nr:phosphotransferase [Spirochaetales bacterium]